MKSLQLKKTGELTQQKSPLPSAASGERLIKITHCAVCRTDAKMWKTGHRDLTLPRIPGHEICGVDEKSGERFVLWPGCSCGECTACLKGAENLCPHMQITGFHRDGGFAEYVTAPLESLIAVPPDLPGDIACMAEPAACTLNALEQLDVQPGERILIYGAGPVGLMAGMAAAYLGASAYVHDIRPDRIERSQQFCQRIGVASGAEVPLDNMDGALNAAPDTAVFDDGLRRLKPGGRFCLFSGLTDGDSISSELLNLIHYRQLQITGAYGCTRRQMEKALDILLKYQDEMKLLKERDLRIEEVPEILPGILKSNAYKYVVSFEDDRTADNLDENNKR